MRRDKLKLRQTRLLLDVREVQSLDAAQKAEAARLERDERAQDAERSGQELDRLAHSWAAHLSAPGMDPYQIEKFNEELRAQAETCQRAATRLAGANRALVDQQVEHLRVRADVEAIKTSHDEQSRLVSRHDEERRQSVNEDRVSYQWRQE